MSKLKRPYCPKCRGTTHLSNAVFCYNDGVTLEEQPRCPHCDGVTLACYAFCHLCGKEVGKEQP